MSDSQRMKVLMLGWEYPPHISGGLGTACEGLTTALAPLDVEIQFVVPQLYGVEHAPHMKLVSPALRSFPDVSVGPASEPISSRVVAQEALLGGTNPASALQQAIQKAVPGISPQLASELITHTVEKDGMYVQTVRVPALLSPYLTPAEYKILARAMGEPEVVDEMVLPDPSPGALQQAVFEGTAGESFGGGGGGGSHDGGGQQAGGNKGAHYGRNLFGEVLRFADRVADWARQQQPHIIHAHDWMTFPAATRIARMHNVPLVVHIHSLEQDRSGNGGANPTIVAIEGAGVRAASRVIAVSHYTARKIHELHGVPHERISVVHNGVYARPVVNAYREEHPSSGPLVLFLGRITYQKGPDYFVEAAAKVLVKVPSARFVMAGSGDMLPQIKERVKALGIDESFEFPGFVRGAEVEHLFSNADAYVMPSVSEPFGISALEAMSYETPVILSRQSGASEVLRHALKVDFWDIDRLAAQIVAVLKYPELRTSIIEMAREEVRRVHWEAAATKVKQVYERALAEG